MKNYIEREAAYEMLSEYYHHSTEIQHGALRDALSRVPAADVKPVVRAAWCGEADGYADGELVYDMWSCPICGKLFEEWDEKPSWNFCPNCGADMRGDGDD